MYSVFVAFLYSGRSARLCLSPCSSSRGCRAGRHPAPESNWVAYEEGLGWGGCRRSVISTPCHLQAPSYLRLHAHPLLPRRPLHLWSPVTIHDPQHPAATKLRLVPPLTHTLTLSRPRRKIPPELGPSSVRPSNKREELSLANARATRKSFEYLSLCGSLRRAADSTDAVRRTQRYT